MHIVSLNSSGKSHLEAAMQYAHKGAAAILSQEHHSRDISWNDLHAHAGKAGWKIAGAQAVATPKGQTSAGVGIAVRSHIEPGRAGSTEDLVPSGNPRPTAGDVGTNRTWRGDAPRVRVLLAQRGPIGMESKINDRRSHQGANCTDALGYWVPTSRPNPKPCTSSLQAFWGWRRRAL